MSEETTKQAVQEAPEDVLKALDWIVLIDHSGSVENPSTVMKGHTLYEEMQERAVLAARVAGKYDDDGITLIHFSTGVNVKDGVTADSVADVFKERRPSGITNMGAALQAAVQKAKDSQKEVVCLVFTDGQASDPDVVMSTLKAAGTELGRPKIGFAFVQIGDSDDAAKFLRQIDDGLEVDICACFTSAEADTMSIEQLVQAARTL